MNFLRVYTATISYSAEETPLYPPKRQAEIDEVKNEKVKREKIGVWKLLQYAVEDTFSTPFSRFTFEKNKGGKWICDRFYFSLSHSGNALAVALSSQPVGVDIQKNTPVKQEKIAEKILNEVESSAYDILPPIHKNSYLLSVWAKKEAAFKREGTPPFAPARIYLDKETTFSLVRVGDEEYFLALSSSQLPLLQTFENVSL